MTSMPHRKPLRMQGWDFTSPGWYFLTICTQNMKPAFGTVVNGRMVLNAAGTVADKFWREIPAHFPRAVVDEYIDTPKVGFLASRGQTALHGKLPIKPSETIISGFLSPMERAVFNAGLTHKRPMIWVRPLGLDVDINTDTACRGSIEMAINEGRLLLLSPFDPTLETPNVRRAAWCNQYVLAHCERLVIGHLNPDGMLACILTEANPEKEIIREIIRL